MIQIGKKVMRIALLAAFVSGAVLAPGTNAVFAAESPAGQEQQAPPQDQQNGGNEHAGHHG